MQKKVQSIWTTDITPDFTGEFWQQDVTHHVIGTLAMFGLVVSALITTAGVAAVGVQTEVAFAQQASAVSQTAAVALAQTTDDTPTTAVAAGGYCPQLSTTFSRGATDATTNPTGQVTELQKFLTDYYDINTQNIVVGTFGRITQSYVVRFQQEQELPTFGIVGSLTRAAIASVCGQPASATGTTQTQTSVPATSNTAPSNTSNPSTTSTTNTTGTVTTTNSNSPTINLFWSHLYSCALNTTPDQAGIAFWVAQTPNINQLAAYRGFFGSSQYAALNTSNSAYVTQLYNCLLGHSPDTAVAAGQTVAGVQFWLNALQNGTSRDTVLQDFLGSSEYQSKQGPAVQSATGMPIGVAAIPTPSITNTPTAALSASCVGSPYYSTVYGTSWHVEATGGSGTYIYQWTLSNDIIFINPSLGGVQTPSVMVNYGSAGTKQASVVVNDGKTSTTANCSVSLVATTSVVTAALTSPTTFTTATPTVTGTAQNVGTFGFTLVGSNGGKAYGSGNISITNGIWSNTISTPLANGTYTVIFYSNNIAISTGSITIAAPNTTTTATPSASLTGPTTFTTATPTLTGTAQNVTNFGFSIGDNAGKVYGSGAITVSNGIWSHTLTTGLPNGTYSVVLYDGSTLISTGSITINAPTTNTTPTSAPAPVTSPFTVTAGGTAAVAVLSFTSNDCTSDGFTVSWGDGTVQTIAQSVQCKGWVVAASPISYQATHTYTTMGNYSITLSKAGGTTPLSSGGFSATQGGIIYGTPGTPLGTITSPAAFWTYLYSCVLGRQPTTPELSFWSSTSGGMTFVKAYQGFFESSQYLALNNSDSAYLTQVYKCVLFRDPDSAGYTYWLNQLSSGYSRDNLLQSFINGTDFKTNVYPVLHSVTLFSYANPVNDMVASVISAVNSIAFSPFALAVDSLTNIFVEMGIGQTAVVEHAMPSPRTEGRMGSSTMDTGTKPPQQEARALFCPTIVRTIGRGTSEGTTTGDVGQLQQFIANHFNLDPQDVVTGHFGSTTEGYLKKFQQEQGIPPAPTAGPLTRAAIEKLCGKAPMAQHGDLPYPSMPEGSTSPNTHTPPPQSYTGGQSNAAAVVEAVNEISDGYGRLFGAVWSLLGI